MCDAVLVGLDVYVGSLTRYHAGDWELIAQQAAREMGLSIRVVRQHDPSDAIRDPEQIRPTVLAWQNSLSTALAEHLASPLVWDEGPDTPYFTDKPTWDCYSDLMLWAAYDEQRQSPPAQHVENWAEDTAYRLVATSEAPARYSHLYEVALWLPCNFGFIFKTEDIAGAEIAVGSSVSLAEQLGELNARTWQAAPETIRQWRRESADYGAPLEAGARFAFAVFFELAVESVKNRVPMRLDW
jgi:hypothetical protein